MGYSLSIRVIIPTYNNEDIIGPCIASIPDDPDIDVIVVDNASSDRTVQVVTEKFPQVTVIHNKENKGFGAACNQGAASVFADALLFLNSDARLNAQTLEKLARYMDQDDGVGICCPHLVYPDGEPQNSFSAFPSFFTEFTNKSLLKMFFPKKYGYKRWEYGTQPFPVDAPLGACMLVRTEIFQRVEEFDEGFFFFLEETDLAYRIRKKGFSTLFCPDASAVHLQGASAGKNAVWSRVQYYRSLFVYFKKHKGHRAAVIFARMLRAKLRSIRFICAVAGAVSGSAEFAKKCRDKKTRVEQILQELA